MPPDFCKAFQGRAGGTVEAVSPVYGWTVMKLMTRKDPVRRWAVENK